MGNRTGFVGYFLFGYNMLIFHMKGRTGELLMQLTSKVAESFLVNWNEAAELELSQALIWALYAGRPASEFI